MDRQEQPFVFKTPTSKTPSKPLSRFTFTAPASILSVSSVSLYLIRDPG